MGEYFANILIIDDNPKLLMDALPLYGYGVDVAFDGMQGIKKIDDENNHYDLILLDIVMPNVDGWEVLKYIRTKSRIKKIPIILLTSVDNNCKMISGLKFGADDYIVKPCILPNLLARIESLLRRVDWEKENNNKQEKVNFSLLTNRELEILSLIAKGNSNKQIADKLFVKDTTIKAHLNSIFKKMKVKNRLQAMLLALQSDLIHK